MIKNLLLCVFFGFVNSNIIILNPENTVSLRGQINEDTSNKFIEDLKNFNEGELNIFINSPGGSVSSGMKIIDHIEMLNETTTINCITDFAASMAFIIFQSCENRYILNSGTLMQHQMSLGLSGNLFNLNNYMKMVNNLNYYLDGKQAKRIGMCPADFVNKITNDWWVNGFDALDNNLADKVVKVKCNKEMYSKKELLTLNTFFGLVKLEFNKCPLLRKPKIITKFKEFTELESIFKQFDSESYINGKLKVKSWF